MVETPRRVLEARDDEGFRSTFMPEVQRELTTEAIESCRKRLAGKAVKPDWEGLKTERRAIPLGALFSTRSLNASTCVATSLTATDLRRLSLSANADTSGLDRRHR